MPIDQLRAERDAIRGRIGQGPPDVSRDYRWLADDLAKEKHYLEGSQWRRDRAQQELDDLGPIRRRTHPAERREIGRRIERFTTEIDRHSQRVGELEAELDQLTPAVLERSAWAMQHRPDLDRLSVIDHRIEHERRLAVALERSLSRDVDRGIGLEL